MESLRDRLMALADARSRVMGYEIDEFDGKEQREVALAAARMALEDAALVCLPPISFDHVDCYVAIRALRDRLADV